MKTTEILYLLFIIVNLGACTTDDNKEILIKKPTVQTSEIYESDSNYVTCTGNIINNEESQIFEKGICWSTKPEPTIDENKIISEENGTTFTCKINNLTENTRYYIRAYATNKKGISYGNTITYQTLGKISFSTINIDNLELTTPTVHSKIINNSKSTILEKGFCWSLNFSPTIKDNKTIQTDLALTFSDTIKSLEINTTYYICAYAKTNDSIFYSDIISFKTFNGVKDIDGNIYKVIKIGNQTWMAENLKTTKYRDGTPIQNITDETTWIGLSSGAWCDYENTNTNGQKFGHLYNGYTVINNKNIAPIGWHVPTDAEWNILENYLIVNGYNYDGSILQNKLAKTMSSTSNWVSSSALGAPGNNQNLNNSSGFNGFPAGYRNSAGSFLILNTNTYWWSCTLTANSIWTRFINAGNNTLQKGGYNPLCGFSIRCIKD